jgi:hypothetical protein
MANFQGVLAKTEARIGIGESGAVSVCNADATQEIVDAVNLFGPLIEAGKYCQVLTIGEETYIIAGEC